MDYRDLQKNRKRIGLDRAHVEAWRDYWGLAIAPAWKHHLRRIDDDIDKAGQVRLREKPTQARGIDIQLSTDFTGTGTGFDSLLAGWTLVPVP
ncbi:MAG: hypothetical protein QMC74_07515 [Myxococcota bacterium]